MSRTYGFIRSPHADSGIKVGNMPEKQTPGLRTVGKKPICTCYRPGRLVGDTTPPRIYDGEGDGKHGDEDHDNGGGEGHKPDQRHAVTGMRISGTPASNSSMPQHCCSRPQRSLKPRRRNVCWKPLRAPPPPPSGVNSASPNGNASRPEGDTGSQAPQGMSTFQRMLTPPVSDTNPAQKKQDSDSVQVFIWNTRPRKQLNRRVERPVIRLPPVKLDPSNPDKQKVGDFRQTQIEAQQKQKRKPKSKRCCDQSYRPNGSDNNVDNERETSPVSSHTRSAAAMSTIRAAHEPSTTPTTSNGSVSLEYFTPSVSPPVKRKRGGSGIFQSATPTSPLSDRPLKRLRGSLVSSQLASSDLKHRTRGH